MVNALHMAAQYGHLEICRYLIEDLGFDINLKDQSIHRSSPLYQTAFHGNFEVCRYRLEKGSKVDYSGIQPLFVSAEVSCFKSFNLVERTFKSLPVTLGSWCKSLLKAQESDGKGAFTRACEYGRLDICKLIYTYGARDELCYDNDGMVFLHRLS